MSSYKIPSLDSFLWQKSVIDKDLTSPPAASKGDRYLIYGTGSGAWAGLDGKIVTYNGSTWDSTSAIAGMVVYVVDEGIHYEYISSWKKLLSNLIINSTPADDTFEGIKTTLVCHETIAQGDVCYINADGEAQLAKADAIANASAVVLATEAGNASDTKTFLVLGFARNDSWDALTAGSFIYLSAATAGKMTNTAPSATNNVIQVLGWAKTTKLIFFNPSLVQVEHV